MQIYENFLSLRVMKSDRRHIFSRTAAILLAAAVLLYSCSPVDLDFNPTPDTGHTEDAPARIPVKEYRNVFIMYSMGFNDLRRYLTEDIADVLSSPLMKNGRDIILIFSHIAKPVKYWPYFDPDTPVSPTLTKISKDARGRACGDCKYRDNRDGSEHDHLADGHLLLALWSGRFGFGHISNFRLGGNVSRFKIGSPIDISLNLRTGLDRLRHGTGVCALLDDHLAATLHDKTTSTRLHGSRGC